jgi:hypothetical protein
MLLAVCAVAGIWVVLGLFALTDTAGENAEMNETDTQSRW